MNRLLSFVVFLWVLSPLGAAQSLEGDDLDTEAEPLGAGYHAEVTALADAGVTYKLYIPHSLAAAGPMTQPAAEGDPEDGPPPPVTATAYRSPRGTPALIVQNPGGKPDILRYRAWAEERGVILIGINKVSNGMPQHNKPRYQDATMRDLAERGVAIHPNLKYTIGMSGGSADGQRMARRHCGRFAGLVLQGAGDPPTGDDCGHLYLWVLAGAEDPIYQFTDKRRRGHEEARERGQQVRVTLYPDLKHEWAPMADQLRALDWMLAGSMLTHPGLADEERTGYRRNLLAQAEAIGGIKDVVRRRELARWLLEVEPLWDEPTIRIGSEDSLAGGWILWTLERSRQIRDLNERSAFLKDAAAWAESLRPVGKLGSDRVLWAVARADERDAEARRDWTLRQQYRQLRDQQAQAGLDPQKLRPLIEAYSTLEEQAAATPWAERARDAASHVQGLVNQAN